jgi:hypothetical protein
MRSRDLVATIINRAAAAVGTLTAGGAGDNTAINGTALDTNAITNAAGVVVKAESVTFLTFLQAVLGAGNKLTTALKIQDSADGSTFADIVMPAGTTIPTTATNVLTNASAGTYQTVAAIGIPLEYCRQYVRLVATPDLDRANTDTGTVTSIAVFGGASKL